MKRIICTIIVNFIFFYIVIGQTNQRIIPPSPNAASLGQYGDIPVSYYSGIPEISIPIYTIKCGSITLPISLNYHASGIKVAQESGWVGLGWSLFAGGVINPVNVSQSYSFYDDIASGYKDGEPDVFQFNFSGYSGKFYFNKRGTNSQNYAVPISSVRNNTALQNYHVIV